ncbi:hypothetical protein FRB94_003063 [Tulasnella sp. JGI-2019a]|nr:hypothetical protein FRB94_003063 [Tulasnella sp. JGI-2019a]
MVNLSAGYSEIKVYTVNGAAPGSASSLPDWLTRRRALKSQGKRRTTKEEVESSIDLIQDFEFPQASNRIKTTRDGHHAFATGIYKPRMRVYDLDQLTLKFERHTNGTNVDFTILSDDWTKTLHLQDDRMIEFHGQSGLYYTTRIPRQGRALAYHYPSCDALFGCVGNEVFRLNLDQGRFLNPLALSQEIEGVNCIDVNPVHQLLSFGTQSHGDGTVEFWDPRSRSALGSLQLPRSVIFPMGTNASTDLELMSIVDLEVTALSSRSDGLSLAVGTSSGHTLLYDLRSPRYFAIKDQGYGLPIKNVSWVEGGAKMAGDGLVVSADRKVIKIWDRNTPSENFASITPATDINHVHHVPGSGLVMVANEGIRMTSYYIPQLGPAPRWCSFLDHITEEMEEQTARTVYEDFKFVERTELHNLGLDHLVGTPALKPYMHGYFLSLKLYDAARMITNPFAYSEHREKLVQQKVEKLAESRIRSTKIHLPKVNQALAAKLQKDHEKRTRIVDKLRKKEEAAAEEEGAEGEDADEDGMDRKQKRKQTKHEKKELAKASRPNLLEDDRFKEMFENPEFEVDVDSREYGLLNPGGVVDIRQTLRGKTAVEDEEEESDKTSSDGLSHSESEPEKNKKDDSDDEGQLINMDRYRAIRADPQSVRNLAKAANKKAYDEKRKLARAEAKAARELENDAKFEKFPEFRKKASAALNGPKINLIPAREGFASGSRDASFGERSAARMVDTDDAEDMGVDNSVEAFEKGMTITWVSGEKSASKGSKHGDREEMVPLKKPKKKKEKPLKGITQFGAGLEKGLPTEERDLTEDKRRGRVKRRSGDDLRSASKRIFRKIAE